MEFGFLWQFSSDQFAIFLHTNKGEAKGGGVKKIIVSYLKINDE